MMESFAYIGFWGHAAVGFFFSALSVWSFHQYGERNTQQTVIIGALALTAGWGVATIMAGPGGFAAESMETARNLGWLCFLYVLLKSGGAEKQPRTIVMIYAVLLAVLLIQPALDYAEHYFESLAGLNGAALAAEQSAQLFRMLFAIGAVVLVHNLYTGSAPEARWGVSLPMAALAAMWMYDLNLYTISYMTGERPVELVATRGLMVALMAPVFALGLSLIHISEPTRPY